MARIPQPLELARLKGADIRNPQRYTQYVPKSNLVLGEPPEYMEPEAVRCWYEVAAICIPGTVTGADSLMLELLANTLAEYRADVRGFSAANKTFLKSLFASFGLGPSERSKLGMDKPPEDNPFARLDD